MVDLVLDDLSRPAGEGFQPGLEFFILPLDLDGLEPFRFPDAGEGEAALLGLIRPGLPDDDGIEHHHVRPLVVKGDNALANADHVGRHAHAAVLVGGQGVQQVLGCGQIIRRGGGGLLGEKRLIPADLTNQTVFLPEVFFCIVSAKGKTRKCSHLRVFCVGISHTCRCGSPCRCSTGRQPDGRPPAAPPASCS